MKEREKSLVGPRPEMAKTYLMPLFDALNSSGIEWAVSHGWEGLPEYVRHDVDLTVCPRDIKQAEAITKEIAEKTGWKIYAMFVFSGLHSYWLLKRFEDGLYFLQIDFDVSFNMRGCVLLDSKDFLEGRMQQQNGIWVANRGVGAAWILLKELIANGTIGGESRRKQILMACYEDRDGLLRALRKAVGDNVLSNKVLEICEKNNWDALDHLAPTIRRKATRFKFRNIPSIIKYAIDVAKYAFSPFLRLFIAFIGPDGCGKTTIVDRVQERFLHRPFNSLMRVKSDFGTLPRLRNIKRMGAILTGRKVEFEDGPPPGTPGMGMGAPVGAMRSAIYIIYYGIGLFLSRFSLLRWRTFAGWIIADRYFYDYYYMRTHLRCPVWFKNLIELFVPKPDFIFYLDRPADQIYRQKKELDIDEIKREQEVIKYALGNKRQFREIDASHGIEVTVEKVCSTIEGWLASYGT